MGTPVLLLGFAAAAAAGPAAAATTPDSALAPPWGQTQPAAPAAPAKPPEAAASSTLLADGTRAVHWTLANGLRVVSRHLPGAHSAAVTLCYRLGAREDPEKREGWAELVAQAAFTGRCGDVPERSLLELDQLRPGGWSLQVGPYLTELTEACPTDLLPGVLHQVCQRLRGVAVNDSLVQRSRAEVRRRLRQNYDLEPEKTLYFLSGEMAAGRPAERAMRYGTGEGLAGITVREVTATLGERLVPANTVLCIVGELGGLDLKTLIQRELGGVPAGKPAPPVSWNHIVPAAAGLSRPDLRQPMGMVGVIAPALTDTMHPYFTAFTVSTASLLRKTWGKPDPPLTSRFQFSISTDPELVRFYPPVTRGNLDVDRLFSSMLDQNSEAIVDSAAIAMGAASMMWLTGGALPPDLLKRALGDPAVIHTLATTLAALEAFGDVAFWAEYRARLARAKSFDLGPFFAWYENPKRRILLVLRPQ